MSTASAATSSDRNRPARSRPRSATSIPARKPGCGARSRAKSGEQMTNRLAGQWGGVPYKYFGEWTDRIAKGELPEDGAAAAARRRAQCRHHVVGMVHAGQISARSDFVRPAQSDGQCLWPAVRLAGIFDRQHADPRSEDQQGDVLQDAGARCRHAGIARARPCRHRQADCSLRPTGATSSLGHARQQSQLHVRRARAACG